MERASTAPTLASAINIGAFNLGNAIAAWLGGLAISSGFGYASVNWVRALMTLAGLGLAALSVALARHKATSPADVDLYEPAHV
ncbi:MFS transporter [Calidifontibacter indicus]|uniref:MFS transporter n=1 Tax=Calidifontibacter indicus TaxID=419650 RepID=UPI0011C02B0E|nr:MFS transporter [Calidifontibacter indicus]